MYKQIETDESCELDTGAISTPVATLADEHGGRCQIIVDDHCYVLLLKKRDGKYDSTAYIFKEAFEILTKLNPPS